MCGCIILMSRQLSPYSSDLSTETDTTLKSLCLPSRLCKPLGPATRALNDTALFTPEGDAYDARPRFSSDADHSAITEDFPTIAWCTPNKGLEEKEEKNIIAQLLSGNQKRACPRGKLVRSISLVSSILEESKSQCKNQNQIGSRKIQAKRIQLAVPMRKQYAKYKVEKDCYDSATKTHFMPLSFRKTTFGIRASQMASTKQYIL